MKSLKCILKLDFLSQCVWIIVLSIISNGKTFQLRLFSFYIEKLVWEREERNGLHVKVVVFTLTLTKLILLGRVWARHDRHVHILKLSKYECSETWPIQIAGAPHVP